MKILIVETEKKPRIAEIDGSLHSMQQVVGGNIEAIYPFEEDVALICNDEGKLNNLPLNRALYHPETHQLYDIISGTFFIFAAPPDEENLILLRLNNCSIMPSTLNGQNYSLALTVL
ncbi:hypothetical protein SDC9_102711 [bioreactor metagenome]|uniref:DUF3846 domain-containing protein n=1 Tax=bioreactor metagenome TaxID=1076179 RepID=A0A645AYF9_9ZZZZ|nr:DUF3846 domain-containing protein [Candidatus Metalachnospira sp.]